MELARAGKDRKKIVYNATFEVPGYVIIDMSNKLSNLRHYEPLMSVETKEKIWQNIEGALKKKAPHRKAGPVIKQKPHMKKS